jgi:alpha-1,6-mannosyltransferase
LRGGVNATSATGWQWPFAGVATLATASAACLALGAAWQPLWAVLACYTLGGLALAWIARDARLALTPGVGVLLLALALRLLAVLGQPLLEDDHHRYLWDGFRTATTLDPYRLAPSAFFDQTALSARWQDILSGINHPDVPSVYGPVLQGLFALAYVIAPGQLGALQGLLLGVDMGVLVLLLRQGLGVRWLLAYAVHPLVLKEAMACAHPDGLLAALLLLALLAWRAHAARWLGCVLGLALATKVSALVVLPMLLLAPAGVPRWRWAGTVCAVTALVLVALYLPFLLAGGDDSAALATMGQHWRFNPLFFRLLEVFVADSTARVLAALLIGAGVVALAINAARQHTAPPLHLALLLLLALSPVVNPWYWLWALPLAVYVGGVAVPAMSVVAVLSYLNTSVLAEVGLLPMQAAGAGFVVSVPLAAVQMAVVLLALWVELGARHRSSRRCGDPMPVRSPLRPTTPSG